MLKKIFLSITFVGLFALTVAGLALYWLVAINPGDSIRPEYLENVLSVESPVFYSDNRTKIGVFFENAHRQYLPYKRIPQNFIDCIVAGEDHHFFEHYGVDIFGIARAMYSNLRAGRVVQGGSTITQQTAKNLYKRQDRSVKEKLKELLYAWRLEYHYSKEKILEFYVNQFYVSGNGRGLGVAARYYFDKPAEELSLIESAFIAGSVKRPNYYNPFIKKSEESSQRARKRAKSRARYVLNKLLELGKISPVQHKENIDLEVPFKQGQMSYSLNTIMDFVKEAMVEPEVEEALVDYGIDNIATSGIRIYTTIDENIQVESLYALRKELSRLSVRLEGYDHKGLQRWYSKLAKGKGKVAPHGFAFGRITSIASDEAPALKVSFSHGRNGTAKLVEGVVDQQSLKLFLASLVRYNRHPWAEAEEGDMAPFLGGFTEGSLVYTSVRGYDKETGLYKLDIERYPDLQGGAVVMRDGVIRAMVGGHENHFFNRATARRLMGSTAKPLLYSAAIQLGWNPLDLLDNSRGAFVYHGQTYFPRPDHHSPFAGVSMNWAGTKSENVASVWLLYNLCDRLSDVEFKKLAVGVGLARGKEESYHDYRTRMRDNEGIVIRKGSLRGLAFTRAVREIGPDLSFEGRYEEAKLLKRFHYELDESVVEDDDDSEEAKTRRQLLKMSYLRIEGLAAQLSERRRAMKFGMFGGWQAGSVIGEAVDQEEKPAFYYNSFTREYAFGKNLSGAIWETVDEKQLAELLNGRSIGDSYWEWDDVMLEGLVSLSAFNQLKDAVDREYRRLSKLPSYGDDVLHQLKDFRVLVGLRYLISLCQEMGVKSPMEPVLSFPLGSNVVTLLDIARAYEGVVTGSSISYGRVDAGDSLLLIDRIESRNGEVIYRPQQNRKKIFDRQTSLAVADILRNVVKYGTGRSAQRDIKLRRQDSGVALSVPVLGKTGTANSFRNSAFAGFLPDPREDKKAFGLDNGYSLATYVGYDDNRPMVKGQTKISGSSGALPVWSRVVNSIISHENYGEKIDLENLAFAGNRVVPLVYPNLGQLQVPSDDLVKIVVDDPDEISYFKDNVLRKYGNGMNTFGELAPDGKIEPLRYFRPFWSLDN